MNTKFNAIIKHHIIDNVGYQTGRTCDDLHFYLFSEDYFVIGYYNASQMLKGCDLDAFDVIDYVQEYEKLNFGETHTKVNSESMVNMLAYIIGEEVLGNLYTEWQDHESGELDQDLVDMIVKELKESF